jgi:hypothetical protein
LYSSLTSLRLTSGYIDNCEKPCATMERLVPGMSQLTNLVNFRFDNDEDWFTTYANPRGALLPAWEAAALRLLRPMASTLKRLEVGGEGGQMLPRALYECTNLEHLSMRCAYVLYGMKNVRGLSKLECLELHAGETPYELCAADAWQPPGLGSLRELRLSHAPADLAYPIRARPPRPDGARLYGHVQRVSRSRICAPTPADAARGAVPQAARRRHVSGALRPHRPCF